VQGVTAPYPTPAPRPYQAAKAAEIATPKAYTVELSGAALAKSLKLEGYTPLMISIKMGLDMKTVDQYLGITASTVHATYVQPKATYTEPKALSQARDQLVQDLNQLPLAQSRWANLVKSQTTTTP